MKLLKLMDINDYFNDNQDVLIVAYNIKLYEGTFGNIPVKYSKYELVPQKIVTDHETIVIELDC